jgi:TonB family protein
VTLLLGLLAVALVTGCATPAPLATVMVVSPRLPPPVQAAGSSGPLPPGTIPPRVMSLRFHSPEAYPAFERRARISGSPHVRLLVDETGRVVDAGVIGTVSPGLDSLALALTSETRFRPGQIDGAPAPMTVDMTYSFGAP